MGWGPGEARLPEAFVTAYCGSAGLEPAQVKYMYKEEARTPPGGPGLAALLPPLER